MAIVQNLGQALQVGGQGTLHATDFATLFAAKYLIETSEDGGYTIDSEDVFNSDGLRQTRIFFNRNASVTLNLLAQHDATPLTDFPEGNMCAIVGFTTWFVESAKVSKSKSSTRVTVTMSQIFTNV